MSLRTPCRLIATTKMEMNELTRISSISSCVVRVPLSQPVSFATRTVQAREYVLVRVTGDDGIVGVGFCYPGDHGAQLAQSAVHQLLGELVVGKDAHTVPAIWQRNHQSALLHGRAGVVMRALSAIDIALWDRNARAAGLPLHKFLGSVCDRVPTYASGGYYLAGKTLDDFARELADYVTAGYRAVKIKVGQLDIAGERERMAVAREAIGPDVLLMLDASNAWRDVASADRFMRLCYEPFDPYWIEEPFGPDDVLNHAALANRTRVPVATGELLAGRQSFLGLMREKACAIVQPDAQVCGGITEYRRIVATAESFGMAVCPHAFHDLHKHLVAASINSPFVEVFTDTSILNFTALLDRQSLIEDGEVVLGDEPGLGFDFDESVVDRYAITPWEEVS